jgi:hypothetical protein
MWRLSCVLSCLDQLRLDRPRQDPLRPGQARERRWAKLHVEPLEDRCLLAWTAIGPAPEQGGLQGPTPVTGRVSALALVNTHTPSVQTLFLGAAGGGVWTSTNCWEASPTYTPRTDNFSVTDIGSGLGAGAIDVGAIAVDTTNPVTTIYVGTGEANYSVDSRYGTGILKSTDGGDTFQLLATGTEAKPNAFFRHAISKIIVDPNDSDNIYASVVPVIVNGGDPADNGIYQSDDGGETWTQIAGGDTGEIGDEITVTDMDYTWNSTTGALTPALPMWPPVHIWYSSV